jgi:hypothetical protein
VIAKSAANVSWKSPLYNDVVQHESDFMEDQERRKNALDHHRDVQLEKLRALNSPLPSPIVKPVLPPALQTGRFTSKYPSNFQPQKPLQHPLDAPRQSDPPPRSEGFKSADRKSTIRELQNDSNIDPVEVGGIELTSTPNRSRQSSTPVTPAKPGPIRMKLPLGDEKAEIGDVRSAVQRANRRGTASQDERAKKWGIDISKFAD